MREITILMPEAVSGIIETLHQAGFEGFAVGGCVRDTFLGRVPDDWDITTNARPQQVKKLFSRTIDTGLQHGTVTVLINKTGYEITTYRIDGEYLDGRHPESVEFSNNLVEDLKRRDFTINAMAYNDTSGLVDEFDGLGDLERKVIRCVGNPKERFTEDALRMMRAVRFSAQLGFEIEEKTAAAIREMSESITKISAERIQVELVKTLLSDHPEYVKLYCDFGLFRGILPVIHDIFNGKHARQTGVLLSKVPKTAAMRYAALLNSEQPQVVRQTLKSLKLDNATIDTASKLVECADSAIEENEPAMREFMRVYGKEMTGMFLEFEQAKIETGEQILGVSLASKRKHLASLKRMYQEIMERGDCTTVKELDITGNDLMKYGITGRQIGVTLNNLLQIVIENPELNDKATLIALVENK
jgi:tRNA nucleotidyltransferase (CCA-adding enzyme)